MENEAPSEPVVAIAEEIVAYLQENSAAGDTPQGVWRWWLRERRESVDVVIVEQALQELVAQGKIGMRGLASGATLYFGLGVNERGQQ